MFNIIPAETWQVQAYMYYELNSPNMKYIE